MNFGLLIAGLIFAAWPLYYQWSIGRVRARIVARGGDVERFDERMAKRRILVIQALAGVIGLALIVLSVVG